MLVNMNMDKKEKIKKYNSLLMLSISKAIMHVDIGNLKKSILESRVNEIRLALSMEDIAKAKMLLFKLQKSFNKDKKLESNLDSSVMFDVIKDIPNDYWYRDDYRRMVVSESDRTQLFGKLKKIARSSISWYELVIKLLDEYLINVEELKNMREIENEREQRKLLQIDENKQEKNKVNNKSVTTANAFQVSETLEKKIKNLLEDEEQYLILDSGISTYLDKFFGFNESYKIKKNIKKGFDILSLGKQYEKYQKSLIKKGNFKPDVKDLINSANAIIDILPDQLLNSVHSSNEKEHFEQMLMSKVKVNDFLKNYEIIFEVFKDYYFNLSESERSNIDKEINGLLDQNGKTSCKFNLFSLSPSDVVNKINLEISKRMVKDGKRYGVSAESFDVADIVKATQLMDLDRVVSLYNQIKYEYKNYFSNVRMTSEEMQITRQSFMENLQYNFARAILVKQGKGEVSFDVEHVKLVEVCKDILGEEPLKFISDKRFIEGSLKIIVDNNEEKLFGIEKFKRAISKSKIYKKYSSGLIDVKIVYRDKALETESGRSR